jgi:outer membrane protein OmpA-like peptidoglycan-associated protein
VSDDKKVPSYPPPDDFSKTTPNVDVPRRSPDIGSDWDKTNYKMPKQPSPDEWGRTVANIKPIDTGGGDLDKTYFPGAGGQKPSVPEWGMTEARTDLANADFGPGEYSGQEEGYGKTTPYFRLPEAERAKYENLPPTPSEQAAQAEQARKAKGGVPAWLWTLLAMSVMFFIMVAGILLAWLLFYRTVGFSVTVRNAPAGSEVRVDDRPVAVTNADGSYLVPNLQAGQRVISIYHPSFNCDKYTVTGNDGDSKEWIVTGCKAVVASTNENCAEFQPGEFDKAERCYNKALDELSDPFTAEQLIKALNILIINFDVNKYDVPPVRLEALKKGATFIKKLQERDPTIVLEIGGHTDSDGSDASNMTLSQNRANAVKDILVRYGVNATGLQTKGYGETQPRFDNTTEQGKFLNRRIQYSIVGKPSAPK